MARPGISYDDVKQAALALIAQGDNPTIQRLRERLGSGSNSTIAAHLRRWQQELAAPQQPLPPDVPEEVLEALGAFWRVALAQAERALASAREEARVSIEEAEHRLVQALAETQRAQATIQSLQGERHTLAARLDQAAQERVALDKELAVERERRAVAERATAEALAGNAEITALLGALREQTGAERDQLRTESAALRADAEARVQHERERADIAAQRQREQIDALRADYQRELAALRQREHDSHERWREQERTLQNELRVLQQQAATLLGDNARLAERNRIVQDDLDRLRGEQQTLSKHYFDALGSLEALKAEAKMGAVERERLQQLLTVHEKGLKRDESMQIPLEPRTEQAGKSRRKRLYFEKPEKE